jgi:hypothetical protein
VLAVIDPGWIDVVQRTDQKHTVVEELEVALKLRKVIIPLFVAGGTMPHARRMPPSLAKLSDLQGVTIDQEYWKESFDRFAPKVQAALQLIDEFPAKHNLRPYEFRKEYYGLNLPWEPSLREKEWQRGSLFRSRSPALEQIYEEILGEKMRAIERLRVQVRNVLLS